MSSLARLALLALCALCFTAPAQAQGDQQEQAPTTERRKQLLERYRNSHFSGRLGHSYLVRR